MAKAINMTQIFSNKAKGNNEKVDIDDLVVGYIHHTTNLEQFKVLKGNREVQYDNQMFEQAKEGYLIPILVNEKNEVIDGQHRLYHAKLANAGINYIVGEGLTKDDVIRVNINQHKWSLKDFIASYMHEGDKDYYRLFKHMNDGVMPVSSLIAIALGYTSEGSAANEIVKNGEFKFNDYDEFIRFIDFFERFTTELDIGRGQRKYKQCIALYTVFKVKNVNLERIIKKAKQSRELDDFINKNLTRKESIQFLIDNNNNRISPSHKDFIEYYINQQGSLIVTD